MVTFVGLLCAWAAAERVFHFNPILMPSPGAIGEAFLANSGRLFRETGITMEESALGFLLGSAGAYLVAVLFVYSRVFQQAIYPYAVALKSTPL
ncbi:MAG TPA: hypothetical protein VL523_03645, partial [Terriglobia bacterium]|nr:hypothetical protein [Terriglobia bacterium]